MTFNCWKNRAPVHSTTLAFLLACNFRAKFQMRSVIFCTRCRYLITPLPTILTGTLDGWNLSMISGHSMLWLSLAWSYLNHHMNIMLHMTRVSLLFNKMQAITRYYSLHLKRCKWHAPYTYHLVSSCCNVGGVTKSTFLLFLLEAYSSYHLTFTWISLDKRIWPCDKLCFHIFTSEVFILTLATRLEGIWDSFLHEFLVEMG